MKRYISHKLALLAMTIATISIIFFPFGARAQSLSGIAGGVGGSIVSCTLTGLLGSINIGSLLGGAPSIPAVGGVGGSSEVPVKDQGVRDNTDSIKASQTFQKQKECSLDGLAWAVGAQLLRAMSDEIINWINGGFNGSPAFMQDPEAFFLDQADQLTGAFISANGPLKGLCGSFGLDIKLSLATRQVSRIQDRYKCTLSSIVRNASNAHLNVSVGTSPNGATLGSLTDGSVLGNSNQLSVNGNSVNGIQSTFEKGGGWAGFLALTTQPQNNPVGAYLIARADLDAQIANSKKNTNTELDRGNGFFSWKKCTPSATTPGAQKCEIQTPGSVIESSLNKTLGASVDRLNAAHELNEIIDAFFNKLLTTTLKNGLGTISLKASGQTQSMLSQLSANSASATSASSAATLQQMSSNTSTYIQPMTDFKYFRDQTLSSLQAEQFYSNSVLAACQNQGSRNQDVIDSLTTYIEETITPMVNLAQVNATDAETRLTAIQNLQTAVQSGDTQGASTIYAQIIGNNYLVSVSDLQTAHENVGIATTTANTWRIQENRYGLQCGLSNASSTQM